MKKLLKIFLLAIFILTFSLTIRITKDEISIGSKSLLAQTNNVWSDISQKSFTIKGERRILPLKYRTVKSNLIQLKNILQSAPFEQSDRAKNSTLIIELPTPDGGLSRFELTQYSMMEFGLALKYPEMKTYTIKGIDDPYATGKVDVTISGFHGMVLTPIGDYYIDPYSSEEKEIYISYYKRDYVSKNKFECMVSENIALDNNGNNNVLISSGNQLRTYRLAVAATGEYTAFFGGTVALGMAEIVTAMNRINGVWEREMSVRMTLIANNNLLVYTNPATDPYTNDDPFAMLGQNQSSIDAVIGSANYDMGHVFRIGGGGVAGLGVICTNGEKAKGVTGLFSPVGDPFYIGNVAHEMGHQYGGNHTFNSITDFCAGNRNDSTAWEPGSGSTIIAYIPICGADNLQEFSDDYFHSGNFTEMATYTQSANGNSCPVITSTGNTPPTVNIPSGGFTIPINTHFQLTGSATDLENPGSLTYCWEEFDLGPAGSPGSPSGNAPIFRSFNPVTSPTRTFPKLSDLLNNTSTIGEILPSYTRSLSFRLTVRDNNVGGGGVNYGLISFNVNSNAGPFLVTQPNTNVSWNSEVTQTVTWNVANSTASPVSCSFVNIKLSVDGGNTFPATVVSNTPNDGSQSVTLPPTNTNQARIKVEAAGNIFFDISNTNFTITDSRLPVITHIPLADMIKQNWPATVTATITSASPLDSSWVIWYKNSVVNTKEFKLINTSGNTYSAAFNSLNSDVAIGDFIYYRIIAKNNSVAHEKDSTALFSFKILDGTLCESFTPVTFPPTGWSLEFYDLSSWTREEVSAFGVGAGSAMFNFYYTPPDTIQSLVTFTFAKSLTGDTLKFDHAYGPYIFGTDSLLIFTSTNGGTSYTSLVRLYGDPSGGTLNTAPVDTLPFVPTSSEWASKKYALPVGTNKIKLTARSGYGNNLYLDNICVGNNAPPTASIITVGIEGFYNISNNKLNMRDTIKIYLRSSIAPYGMIDSGKTILDSSTFSCTTIFTNAQSGTYYVVIKHRNSIETWSKSGGQTYTKGATFSYDFTSSSSQAFGNNLILRGIKYCIYSGDVNQDYSVDLSDMSQIDNGTYNFLSGYVVEDLNGDFFVDLDDYAIADNNAFNFVTRQAPTGAAHSPSIKNNVVNITLENKAVRQKYESDKKMMKKENSTKNEVKLKQK